MNDDDILLWPDGTWAYAYELEQMQDKTDDYEVIPFGSTRWTLIQEA